MPAFDYGRKAARDKFSLRRESKAALDTFNGAFKNVLKLRSDGSVEEAARKLKEECYPFLGEKEQKREREGKSGDKKDR